MAKRTKRTTGSKSAYTAIEVSTAQGVGVVWLNRPERRNVFDAVMIAELQRAFAQLGADRGVRAVVIAGRGPVFCAGADMAWLQRAASLSRRDNDRDTLAYASMLAMLDALPKPTVARVHGLAVAGGLGLVGACDIAIAATDAMFAASEVRVGLNAATISPYLVRAIGVRQARRYVLSAERFTAAEAYRLGLIHELVPHAELDASVNAMLGELVQGAPGAQATAKAWLRELPDRAFATATVAKSARLLAQARIDKEGREGIAAFLGKRKPSWHPKI